MIYRAKMTLRFMGKMPMLLKRLTVPTPLYPALLNDLWVEDFSESYLGKTARGPRGPNYPPVALI